jgi:uncharacterized protein with HEPN domain
MNLNDLANLGQIIGAIAVVVSLFYVANQIRQNTNAVRSATAHRGAWRHPEVNWSDIAKMRDLLVHAYHRVSSPRFSDPQRAFHF